MLRRGCISWFNCLPSIVMKKITIETPEEKQKKLEALTARILAIIDAHITLAVRDKIALPYYDLNEMIKDETESNTSPLHLSIKFKRETEFNDSECDIHGNYFGLLWMMKHRDAIMKMKSSSRDVKAMMQLELYTLWHDDIEEMDGFDVNNIDTVDAYTTFKGSREIYPINF